MQYCTVNFILQQTIKAWKLHGWDNARVLLAVLHIPLLYCATQLALPRQFLGANFHHTFVRTCISSHFFETIQPRTICLPLQYNTKTILNHPQSCHPFSTLASATKQQVLCYQSLAKKLTFVLHGPPKQWPIALLWASCFRYVILFPMPSPYPIPQSGRDHSKLRNQSNPNFYQKKNIWRQILSTYTGT